MDIGSMRQRIILQKHILHTDEIGNHQSQWEKFYSCFAYVNLASGKENVPIPRPQKRLRTLWRLFQRSI